MVQKEGRFRLDIRTFLWWGWWSTGTGWPERWWTSHPWKHSEWSRWSSGNCTGVGSRGSKALFQAKRPVPRWRRALLRCPVPGALPRPSRAAPGPAPDPAQGPAVTSRAVRRTGAVALRRRWVSLLPGGGARYKAGTVRGGRRHLVRLRPAPRLFQAWRCPAWIAPSGARGAQALPPSGSPGRLSPGPV